MTPGLFSTGEQNIVRQSLQLVPGAGIEPARPFGQRILSP